MLLNPNKILPFYLISTTWYVIPYCSISSFSSSSASSSDCYIPFFLFPYPFPYFFHCFPFHPPLFIPNFSIFISAITKLWSGSHLHLYMFEHLFSLFLTIKPWSISFCDILLSNVYVILCCSLCLNLVLTINIFISGGGSYIMFAIYYVIILVLQDNTQMT